MRSTFAREYILSQLQLEAISQWKKHKHQMQPAHAFALIFLSEKMKGLRGASTGVGAALQASLQAWRSIAQLQHPYKPLTVSHSGQNP